MPKVIVTDEKGLYQGTGSGVLINNNTSTTPAYIILTSANGNEWYLSVGNDGKALVLSASIPTGNESSAGDDWSVALA